MEEKDFIMYDRKEQPRPTITMTLVRAYHEKEKSDNTMFGNMTLDEYKQAIEMTFDIVAEPNYIVGC